MSLLIIICTLFFIASFSSGIFYLIKGLIKNDFTYIKTGLICFFIALAAALIPLWNIVIEITDAFK